MSALLHLCPDVNCGLLHNVLFQKLLSLWDPGPELLALLLGCELFVWLVTLILDMTMITVILLSRHLRSFLNLTVAAIKGVTIVARTTVMVLIFSLAQVGHHSATNITLSVT